ncbi:pollen-specific leucine-rich repeat extensin-like protein 1 isoform X2 [Kryptolebias marmoratus]|uniref:pollen-specific leucine-rich repeat extensin-like protein 1 isoform X2 n=1 Tax=Kryptolebias marmoratus TaxID=37003 RepID=UPI0007F8A52B|nr:pollen-specific leucine-rich repeat extensin-like protein 1 isoform X2 [Kryptolebias marmoratus]
MPRSASKTKPNKQKPRPAVKETTPTDPEQEVEYIVPGCLSRSQWNDMLIQEDADETVGEIVDELLGKVMERCYKVYIERQLEPYSAYWAEKYLTQIVEQQFLCPDEGEGLEEACRTEDSEPMPATPDSWAQGCVPVVQASNQPDGTSQQELADDQVLTQTEPSVKEECEAFARTNKTEPRPKKPASEPPCVVPCPRSPAKTNRKKDKQANTPPKKVPVKMLPSLSGYVKKNDVEVKDNNMKDTALKDKAPSACHLKKRQPIPKLDPSRLPQRYLFPEYEIVDQTKPKPRKPAGLPRLEPKLNKVQSEMKVSSPKPPVSFQDQPEKPQKRREDDARLSKHEKERRGSSGSLRLDVKVPARGVSLLDSQAVGSSPFKCDYPSQPTKMKPIPSAVAVPLFSVDQVTAGPPPRVTPLIQSKNGDTADRKV